MRRERFVRPLMLEVVSLSLALGVIGCSSDVRPSRVLTLSGSAVGREAEVLRQQLARYEALQQGWRVERRATPDAADERRQLYVQWLNAHAERPDVLQLDVIWTAEFAAAGWIRPLDAFQPATAGFFPATIAANRWAGGLYALPWFVDVGMLYWRRDLLPDPPATFDELLASVRAPRDTAAVPYGFVWQGARYEGLVTVFLEHLGGFGGRLLDEAGRVVVDDDAGVRALTFMRDAIWTHGAVPTQALTWQEEQTRFAFQNGQAALMRNWPYASALLGDPSESKVAGRFDVAPMPAAGGGTPTAALGGSQLAINAFSPHPEAAFDLLAFLTAPEQMLERARVTGQWPARPALYDEALVGTALGVDPDTARRLVERARPRPTSPIYSELSEILQVHLHRALSRQREPRPALAEAARQMRAALQRAGLAGGVAE